MFIFFFHISAEYLFKRREFLINQGDMELATLNSIQAELDSRRAEIHQTQRDIRSSTDLTKFGRGQGI